MTFPQFAVEVCLLLYLRVQVELQDFIEVMEIGENTVRKPNESILVVALDGLDYELIQKFGLKNIPQKEFGQVDNQTGMASSYTTELWTSFITGKTYEQHGVEGLKKYTNPRINKFEKLVKGIGFFDKFVGVRRANYELLGCMYRGHSKEDLNVKPYLI